MRKILVTTAIAGALLGSAPAGAHEELAESGTYDLSGGTPVVGLTHPSLRIGGTMFAAPGFAPTRVVVSDSTDAKVGFVAGQDVDGDQLFGEIGEPRVEACGGSITLGLSAVPFREDLPVFVNVRTVDHGCVGGIGTSGQIDLYVEIPDAQ